MTPPARTVRKFNPGTGQTDDEVINQFVVRDNELEVVLDVLRSNIDAACCQSALVVAPRGAGKTMLLARTAAELRANPDYSQHLLPVRFGARSAARRVATIRNLIRFMVAFYSTTRFQELRNAKALLRTVPHRPPKAALAAGHQAEDLVDLLSTDEDKADGLTPLLVALRQESGKEVRAAEEILEVAADIRASWHDTPQPPTQII